MGIFKEIPSIETGRLFLRKLRSTDAEDMYAYMSDSEVTRHLDWNGPESVDEMRGSIETWNGIAYAAHQHIRWGITVKDSDAVIGSVYLFNFEWDDPSKLKVDIGYDLSRNHWNRGIMTEALNAMVPFAFSSLSINRLQALVTPLNEGSRRVLLKTGFKEEGLLRDFAFLGHKGRWADVAMFSILRRDLAAGAS